MNLVNNMMNGSIGRRSFRLFSLLDRIIGRQPCLPGHIGKLGVNIREIGETVNIFNISAFSRRNFQTRRLAGGFATRRSFHGSRSMGGY